MEISEANQLRTVLNHISPLAEEEWQEFVAPLKTLSLRQGEVLLREGEICDFVAFINKGAVRVYEIIDGVEINRTFFMQGFFATEYKSFLLREPSQEYLEVLTHSDFIMIPHDHLQKFYDKYRSFERLGRRLSEMLYLKLREKLERYQVKTPEERYQEMLTANPQFLDIVPHYHVASYLGITPQSLSRIRKRLKTLVH
ncbi:MAG: Crp/Fnr family transcriptional regulator [Bacteroidota bacterium]